MVVGMMIKPVSFSVLHVSGTVLVPFCIMSYILYNHPVKETLPPHLRDEKIKA